MDIKHVLSRNPLRPAYRSSGGERPSPTASAAERRMEYEGGTTDIGHTGARSLSTTSFPGTGSTWARSPWPTSR